MAYESRHTWGGGKPWARQVPWFQPSHHPVGTPLLCASVSSSINGERMMNKIIPEASGSRLFQSDDLTCSKNATLQGPWGLLEVTLPSSKFMQPCNCPTAFTGFTTSDSSYLHTRICDQESLRVGGGFSSSNGPQGMRPGLSI